MDRMPRPPHRDVAARAHGTWWQAARERAFLMLSSRARGGIGGYLLIARRKPIARSSSSTMASVPMTSSADAAATSGSDRLST